MKLNQCGGVLYWLFHQMTSVLSGISTGPETVLFSCDFETDFCDMVQLTDGDFNWTRHSGLTPTPDTGPSSAYGGSYYMYMEATDHVNQNARITTTNLNYQGVVCMSFAYHMYGAHTKGVYTRITPSAVSNWYMNGDQGNHWREATTEYDLLAGDGLAFYGSVGSGTAGDIAVDDVIVRTGSCKRQVDLPYSCSFESGFCSMTQSNNDYFDWTRYDRQTGSPYTGPSQAYDGSWFLYIETSDQRPGNGFWAGIETPAFSHTGPVCVRFHYHMFGVQVGTLIALLRTENGSKRIFDESGNQDNQWKADEITVADFQHGSWIEFTGTRGDGPSGDIAIDGVIISTDECNACQVNNGDCQHICHKTTQGGRICTCDDGFRLSGDSDTACIDVDECLTESLCAQQCHNSLGGYACSCDDTHILTTDGHHCIDCKAAYQRKFDASQAFSSECPTMRLLSDVTLESCLLEACKDNVSVVAFVNTACALKDCIRNDIRLVIYGGATGWDIYVRNATWSQEFPGSVEIDGGFPLWKLLVGVILGTVVLVAVGVAVALHFRKQRISTNRSNSAVHYENDTVHVTADRHQPLNSKEDEEQKTETGVYSVIQDPPYEQMVPQTVTSAVYQNTAFQGEGSYQALNPDA